MWAINLTEAKPPRGQSLYKVPKRPHKRKDLTFIPRPIIRGIPEFMCCRVLLFFLVFGAPSIQTPYHDVPYIRRCEAMTEGELELYCGGLLSYGVFYKEPGCSGWYDVSNQTTKMYVEGLVCTWTSKAPKTIMAHMRLMLG